MNSEFVAGLYETAAKKKKKKNKTNLVKKKKKKKNAAFLGYPKTPSDSYLPQLPPSLSLSLSSLYLFKNGSFKRLFISSSASSLVSAQSYYSTLSLSLSKSPLFLSFRHRKIKSFDLSL